MKKRFKFTLLFVAVSATILSAPAFAQWTQVNEPKGDDFMQMVIDTAGGSPDIILGATNGDIFVSSDSGAGWNRAYTLPSSPDLTASYGRLFAAVGSQGLYSSTDDGTTWTQLMSGDFGKLYSHDSSVMVTSDLSIYISRDLGATWAQIDSPFVSASPYCFATAGSTILVGTSNGIVESGDGGVTWGMSPAALTGDNINSIYVKDSTIIASSIYPSLQVFHSTNLGASWEQLPGSFGQTIVMSISAANGTLYGATLNGCFVSADSGRTWTSSNAGMGAILLLRILPVGRKLIAATAHDGVYVSADSGMTWKESNDAFPSMPLTSVASMGSTLISGANTAGLFLSTDKGRTWAGLGLTNGSFSALAVTGSKLFAANYNGLNISSDGGATWTLANVNLNQSNPEVDCITYKASEVFIGTGFDYIYHSTDDGATWQQTDIGLTNPWVQSVAMGKRNVFATSGGVLYVSTNDGGNWESASTSVNGAWRLTASDDNIILGLEENGIDLSTDNGATWPQVLSIPQDVILAFATNGSRVFAGTGLGKVYASVDFGNAWKEVPGSFATNSVNEITVCDSSLFLASDSSGLWQCPLSFLVGNAPAVPSPDSPADSSVNLPDSVTFSWGSSTGTTFYTLQIAYDNSFTNMVRQISLKGSSISVALSPDTTYYWQVAAFDSAGALGWSGTRSFETGTATGIEQAVPIPKAFALLQNYPNPFNPTTLIRYRLPKNSAVTLEVYDVLGRLVRTLVNERQTFGEHSVTFDAANLPSGVYFYRILAGAYTDTKKLLLLK